MSARAEATRARSDGTGRSRATVVAWVLTGLIVAASLALVVSELLGDARPVDPLWRLIPPLYAVLGTIIVSRTGGNRVGWLLVATGAAIALPDAVDAALLPEVAPGALSPGLFLVLILNQVSWMLWLFPLFMLLYVFPSGHLLTRRWRWVPIMETTMFVTLTTLLSFGVEIGPSNEAWTVPNPMGFIGAALFDSAGLLIPWVLGLAMLAGGAVVSIVARYRRSGDVERAQLKWVMYAVMLFGVAYAFLIATSAWTEGSWFTLVALDVAVGAVPVAIFIAVLKFRLYEIDVIISRSITFGVLAAFIGAVYVGTVVGVGALFDQLDGSNVALSVAATALVALVFQPVRGRVERLANRMVYGQRATPYEVLAKFSHRVAEESSDDVLGRIPRLLVDGTGAAAATLWVRRGHGFRAASVWPDSEPLRSLDGGETFEDPEADLSLPVFHDGDLLGGISLVAARGATITPPEAELVANLADGLGLTLRNSLLTAALRRQVVDLRRSRDRVVTASDEARRSLEHDLDSGPQQQLVAVKVKLGPLRKLAEQAGAAKTAQVLADVEILAGEAIQAVRDFATGIYPPLLGAEGLAIALGQETHRAALPVGLEVDGVGRYPREIEAAVYFSILEALQNTAKYACASRAQVRLSGGGGALRFDVTDDGIGFDATVVGPGAGLNGMADRLDNVGGKLTIRSAPGAGTTVSGVVPIDATSGLVPSSHG